MSVLEHKSDNFGENKNYHESLAKLVSSAIQDLASRLESSIYYIPGIYHLCREDIEELRNDAILLCLQKITDGNFEFQGYDPLSYTLGVFRKLLANRLRKRKLETTEFNGDEPIDDLNPEDYLVQKETERILGEQLKKLGGHCEQIIRLKYFLDLKDQEVIDKNMTTYTTVDSLKTRRSQCLKKLAAMLNSEKADNEIK